MKSLIHACLLPSFKAEALTERLVDNYFASLPTATSLVADILSDSVGYDPDKPFNHNRLLVGVQRLINKEELDDKSVKDILKTLGYIDFKFALIFYLELCERFNYQHLLQLLAEQDNRTFLKRLNSLLSVLHAEFLCTDSHNAL